MEAEFELGEYEGTASNYEQSIPEMGIRDVHSILFEAGLKEQQQLLPFIN